MASARSKDDSFLPLANDLLELDRDLHGNEDEMYTAVESNPSPLEKSSSPGPVKSKITVELVSGVLNQISQDPILALALKTTDLLANADVKKLVEMLRPLEQCVVHRRVSVAALKESSWKKFYAIWESLSSAINSHLNQRQLSSFILLKTFEHLISITYSHPSADPEQPPPITDEEHDILIYVGGFVLFRSRKFFSNNQFCLSVVNSVVKGADEAFQGKLVVIKSRGGLCEPKEGMCEFFVLCEGVFRELFVSFQSVQSLSVTVFKDAICCREEILFQFYECTSESHVDIDHQETVLLKILEFFFVTRCRAKCRQYFEKYLTTKNELKRKKALRKEIVKDKDNKENM